MVLKIQLCSSARNSLELEDGAQMQWVEVNWGKKKFLPTSPLFSMVSKRKYKHNVGGNMYDSIRNNSKEIRELASKAHIVDRK